MPFLGCVFLLDKIETFEIAEAYTVRTSSDNETEERPFSLVFFGDAMFDRNVRKLMEQNGFSYPFDQITPFVKNHDIGILNLEGVYSNNQSVSINNSKILRFTFDPQGTYALSDAGFKVVSQANNHTNDFGKDGGDASRNYLKSSYIEPVGDFFNGTDPVYLETRGEKVSVIAFNEFSYENFEITKQRITKAKEEGYFVIMFPHWGVEYERYPNNFQKTLAHEWVDLGADMIIGSHPHVIQTMEEYKGKPIFYSLGNFIFDQYFSKETEVGLAVSIFVISSEVSFKVTPFTIPHSVPTLMSKEDSSMVLKELADDSDINKVWRDLITKGKAITIKK